MTFCLCIFTVSVYVDDFAGGFLDVVALGCCISSIEGLFYCVISFAMEF